MCLSQMAISRGWRGRGVGAPRRGLWRQECVRERRLASIESGDLLHQTNYISRGVYDGMWIGWDVNMDVNGLGDSMGKRCTFCVRGSRNFVDGAHTARTWKRAPLTNGENTQEKRARKRDGHVIVRNIATERWKMAQWFWKIRRKSSHFFFVVGVKVHLLIDVKPWE